MVDKSFLRLIESIPLGVVLINHEGVILDLNKQASILFGVKQKEIIGGHFPKIEKSLQRCFSSSKHKIFTSIFEYHNKNGEEQFLEVNCKKININKDFYDVAAVFHDVTPRVIAEREHRIDHERVNKILINEQKQRVRAEKAIKSLSFLTKASNVLTSSLNYETRLQSIADLAVPYLADLCVVDIVEKGEYIDNVAVSYIDSTKKHLVYKLQKQYIPDLKSSHPVARAFNTGKAVIIPKITESILKSLSYSPSHHRLIQELDYKSYIAVPLVAHGKKLGIISFLTTVSNRYYNKKDLDLAKELAVHAALSIDNAILYKAAQEEITRRKKIEEELKKSKNQLEAIIQNVEDGIIVRDVKKRPIYANKEMAKILNYSSVEELLKYSIKEVLSKFKITDESGKYFPIEKMPVLRASKGEESPKETLLFQETKTGEKKWLILRSKPIFNDAGKVQLIVNVVSDITDRKHGEQQRDMFIGFAGHELKNNLAGIKAFVQLLQKQSFGKNKNKSFLYLTRVDGGVNKLTKLINDLLDITKVRAGKLDFFDETIDFNNLVDEIIEEVQATTRRRIIKKGQIQKQIKTDKNRLGQVIINLILNALKYSPQDAKVIVHVKSNNKGITIGVQDFGIGINKEDQKRIFDPYFQVKDIGFHGSSGLGLGLGLYLSKEIIKHYFGDIWVESKKNKGSTFYFFLPNSY